MKLLSLLLSACLTSAFHFLGPDGEEVVSMSKDFTVSWLIQDGDEPEYVLGYMFETDHLCRKREIVVTTAKKSIVLAGNFFPRSDIYAICAMKLGHTGEHEAPQAISGPFKVIV